MKNNSTMTLPCMTQVNNDSSYNRPVIAIVRHARA